MFSVCVCVCVCVLGSMCTFFLLRDLFFTYFASFYYPVIHSILFHYIHVFIWISCIPLIIFNHLYVSRVKPSNFLYSLSIITKRRRICGEYVVSFLDSTCWGEKNTFLCKGEMCFILLRGVLTSFFLYTGLVTMFTYIVHIFDIYMMMYILFHLSLHVLFLFYLYTHVSYTCMQSIISVLH